MSYPKWFVEERANGSCFSIAEHVKTKSGRVSVRFLAHVSDGLPKKVAELIASTPRVEYENKALLDQVQKLKDENAALKEQLDSNQKTATDLRRVWKRIVQATKQ